VIIVDYNQVAISNLMGSGFGRANVEVNETLVRHMILNTVRSNRVKFTQEFGEVVIACDDKNYWRKDIFPYYKASRKKNRQESGLDWNEIFRVLNSVRDELCEYFPYRVIQVESAEADDVVAALCDAYGKELGGDPILILSGDKDFAQLQKYSNVSQFDPTRKRWIKQPDPSRFLLEHIIKGDQGDGIPNVLSSDDTFVTEARQKPIRSKFLTEITSTGNPEETEAWNEEIARNFDRNRRLIDLSLIPQSIKAAVMTQYDNQSNKNRDKLFNYFIKFKLKNLTEHITEF
jgi:hypothetical protein